ncbi:hypothetical protein IFO70_22850 [Phormidium tenue FACHB-886]|nr:hypothetical protein [Phormidium tenue FACHB-886]
MFNNPFVRAAGIVAICYVLLQALGWGLKSLAAIAGSFSAWIRFILVPHAWQIALAAGVAYMIITALTTSRDR